MRLSQTVIRILSEQDDFGSAERALGKGIENLAARRIDRLSKISFRLEKVNDLKEIRFAEFRFQDFLPAFFDLNVHNAI